MDKGEYSIRFIFMALRKKVIKPKLLSCCTYAHTCWQLALKNSHCGKADHCPQLCSSALKMCGSFENSVISLSALNVRTDFSQINRKVPSDWVQKPDCSECGDAGMFQTGPEDCETQALRNQIPFQKKNCNIMFTYSCKKKMSFEASA